MTAAPNKPTLWERDRELAAQGVPICPHCGERNEVEAMPNTKPLAWWCDRCRGYLTTLEPRRGRWVPDF